MLYSFFGLLSFFSTEHSGQRAVRRDPAGYAVVPVNVRLEG
jgi:hypothetical protein